MQSNSVITYNELGYNEYSVITKVILMIKFPGYNERNPVITNVFQIF